jgi:hypothetical protein
MFQNPWPCSQAGRRCVRRRPSTRFRLAVLHGHPAIVRDPVLVAHNGAIPSPVPRRNVMAHSGFYLNERRRRPSTSSKTGRL